MGVVTPLQETNGTGLNGEMTGPAGREEARDETPVGS